ncbi:hypothetical protein Vretifemale_17805 [Volvox reticuliferus]|nr:hypothetical protein Vretifemale_17805 [Volvox reticuliferus]
MHGANTIAAGWSLTRGRASQELKSFWQALLGLDITVDNFLSLPSGVYLLGKRWWGSSLLVRSCYRGLFDRLMSLHSSNTNKRFLITGIGKTYFPVVLMYWLVKEEKVDTIVYESQNERYLFTSKGTYPNAEKGSIMDFDEEIDDSKTWSVKGAPCLIQHASLNNGLLT